MATSPRMAALRAAFNKKQDNNNNDEAGYVRPYPFWNMGLDDRVVIRFLPDLDQDNPHGFIIENNFHWLRVNGRSRRVASLTMWGEQCPITQVATEYFNQEGDDSPNGRKYWKKREYCSMVLLVEDPLPLDEVTKQSRVGTVVPVALGPQIYKLIQAAFEEGELESDPDGIGGEGDDPSTWGYDFIIRKSKQGDYNTYAIGTKFANRPRPLTEAEVEAANAGRVNLTETLRMKKPTLEYVQQMLSADLNGSEFEDGDTPSVPNAVNKATASNAPPAAAPAAAPAPKQEIASGTSDVNKDSVNDLVERLRRQQQANN